jgi:hypothetical protein
VMAGENGRQCVSNIFTKLQVADGAQSRIEREVIFPSVPARRPDPIRW